MSEPQNTDAQNPVPKDAMHIPEGFGDPHHAHVGPILGVLVIMLVLIFSGLYIWGGMLSDQMPVVEEKTIINNEPETPRAVADTQILETLSPSDELDAISADLDGTHMDSLETDLGTIDAELNAAFGE